MTSEMSSHEVSKGVRVTRLKAIYLWAASHHDMVLAHWAIVKLHGVTGAYCTWERHIDGGH